MKSGWLRALLSLLGLLALWLAGCATPGPPTVASALPAAAHAQASRLIELAKQQQAAEQHAAAVDTATQALAFIEARGGRSDPLLWQPLRTRALSLELLRQSAAAQADLQRLLQLSAAFRDPARTATVHLNLATLSQSRDDGQRDLQAARRHFDTALQLLQGRDHSGGMLTLTGLIWYAGFAFQQDDLPLWRSLLDRAQQQMREMRSVLPPDRAEVASSEALYAWRTGDFAAALGWGRQAFGLLDSQWFDGDRRRDVLLQRHLAQLTHLGLLDEAAAGHRQLLARAVAPVERQPAAFAPEALDLAFSALLAAADVELRARRPEAAQAYAQRMGALQAAAPGPLRPLWQRQWLRLQAGIAEQRGDLPALQALLTRLLAAGSRCDAAEAWQAYTLDRLGRRAEADAWMARALQQLPSRCQEENLPGYLYLARLQAGRGQLPAAILLGKLAVEQVGQQRASLAQLDLAVRIAFAQAHDEAYYRLAGWLADAQRFDESEAVLSLLKVREFEAYTRGPAGPASGPLFQPEEQRWRDRLRDQGAAALASAPAPERPAARVAPTEPSAGVLLPGDAQVTLWQDETSLHALIRRPGQAAPQRVKLPMRAHQLRLAILQARSELARQRDPQARAARDTSLVALQQLHRQLWLPVQQQLDAGPPVRLLLLSLHGSLRFVPFAALHDGQRYLVERQATLVLATPPGTGSSAGSEKPAPAPAPAAATAVRARLAAFAAPDGGWGLPPLPFAAQEVDSAVQASGGAAAGAQRYVGRDFNRQRLFDSFRLAGQVHVASHFTLAPGDARQSFLLMGDGTRTPAADFGQAPLSGVGLFVLAACNTAVPAETVYGSGQELESFATLLARQGVNTVLGSLDRVEDAASARLMATLYPLPATARPRDVALALQKAQQALLRAPDGRFAHPVYWSSYVVMAARP